MLLGKFFMYTYLIFKHLLWLQIQGIWWFLIPSPSESLVFIFKSLGEIAFMNSWLCELREITIKSKKIRASVVGLFGCWIKTPNIWLSFFSFSSSTCHFVFFLLPLLLPLLQQLEYWQLAVLGSKWVGNTILSPLCRLILPTNRTPGKHCCSSILQMKKLKHWEVNLPEVSASP